MKIYNYSQDLDSQKAIRENKHDKKQPETIVKNTPAPKEEKKKEKGGKKDKKAV